MIQKIFVEFDKIMSDTNEKLKAFAPKYDILRSEAEKKITATYYGKSSMRLGHFCPSLIHDKISNFKRDTLKKTLSKNAKGYVSYEVDENGKLIRMRDVNSFGTVIETYVIRENQEEFSVAFSGGTLTRHDGETVWAHYDADNKIIRADFISNSTLWSEIYRYADYDRNRIACTEYYYVPGLKGSDKSAKPGDIYSPASQSVIDIFTNDQKEIQRVEYGRVVNGKRKVSFVWDVNIIKRKSTVPFETEFNEWMDRLNKGEKPDKNIIAFNFGLFEAAQSYSIYLIGAKAFGVTDDWATQVDFEPNEKYLIIHSGEIKKLKWNEALEKVADTIKKYVHSENFKVSILKDAEAITTGFDDGNLIRIK